MKLKTVRAIAGAVLLSLLLLLSSCGGAEVEPRAVLRDFCRIYSMEARIFDSGAAPDSEEYIDGQTVTTVFCAPLPVGVDFALALHSKLGSVREVGVFRAGSSSDSYELIRLIEERLGYLSSADPSGEPFIFRRGGILAYGFLEDGDRAEELLRSLL